MQQEESSRFGFESTAAEVAAGVDLAGRVAVVTGGSSGHRFGPVNLDDPNYQQRPYDKWEAYGQAKTANIWHALEVDRRLQGDGVRAEQLVGATFC